MSTSDRQPGTTPTRVVPDGLTRAEFRDFKKRLAKLKKQARCHEQARVHVEWQARLAKLDEQMAEADGAA